MNRNFIREFDDDDPGQITEKLKIGVVSLGRGAGATFFSTCLAKYLANQKRRAVSFIDLNQPVPSMSLIYHAIGIDQRFISRSFFSFYNAVKNGTFIKQHKNMDAGINWALMTPTDREQDVVLNQLETSRLINNIYGDWIVCDFGCTLNDDSLNEMDLLFAIIDPLPSKLLSGKKSFQQYRQAELMGHKIIWIINRYNSGVSRKLMKQYLKLKNYFVIPMVREDWIYASEYSCKLPFEHNEIKKTLEPLLEEIVNRHILFT